MALNAATESLTIMCSASSLGMMSEEEKKMQRIEDIKELLT